MNEPDAGNNFFFKKRVEEKGREELKHVIYTCQLLTVYVIIMYGNMIKLMNFF